MPYNRNDGNTNAKDEARTPSELFTKLNDRFNFGLDICASETNHLCEIYYDKEMDALDLPWKYVPANSNKVMPSYCNPPYSDPSPFIEKGYGESLTNGAIVAMLLPADTSTKSFHKFCMKANEIVFLEGRVKFNNPNGTPMKGSPVFGSMIVVFDLPNKKCDSTIMRSWDWRNKPFPI
jgi:site-specific DNA-methyltransferase (adenine-specific)